MSLVGAGLSAMKPACALQVFINNKPALARDYEMHIDRPIEFFFLTVWHWILVFCCYPTLAERHVEVPSRFNVAVVFCEENTFDECF